MAKKQFLASLELKILSALDSITSGFIGLGAKSDGLYYKDGTTEGKVWHSANDGSGSGLDADKLDGQEANYFQQAISVNASKLLGRYSATTGAMEEIQIGTGLVIVGDVLKVNSSYTHPTGFSSVPATALINGDVISQISVNAEGHVTGVTTRQLTYADVNAQEEILVRPWSLIGNSDPAQEMGIQNIGIGSGLNIVDGKLVATGGGSNFYSKIELTNSPAPISAGAWSQISGLGVAISQSGAHLVSCHVSLSMGSTAGFVAARLRVGTTVIASGEKYTNHRADFHLSSVVNFTGTVSIQIYSSVAGTSPVATTQTALGASATQLHVIKLI